MFKKLSKEELKQKLTIIEHGDSSVDMQDNHFTVDIPFNIDDADGDEKADFRNEIVGIYNLWCEGRLTAYYYDELQEDDYYDFSGNDYPVLVSSDISEIRGVDDSSSYWEKHPSYNNWFLQGYDMSKSHNALTYGFVEEVRHGEDTGKFTGSCPKIMDEDGSDSRELGMFDDLESAMKAVLEANHPDYDGVPV